MILKVKKLHDNSEMPTRGSQTAAGWDLYAYLGPEGCTIEPHTTKLIPTGLAIEISDGYWAGVFARSGMASKQGLRPANCTGVIDSDYRGEVMVALHNDTDRSCFVSNNTRIAQLVILPQPEVTIEEVDELSSTERNDNGFGSTDK